ncbi:hypothetical protein [Geofilum rubicundum]|uniref:YD repeat protein n=1 Tax=Geofilum rubicundum JCM 15548 TaxID=1236989 RepID=A0A0E9M3V8_9BACT|nr:hypothetical protein [Geofilum rubicundum]GAO31860.1 hypothetical protein JCM15548_14264 [Geofilum rubicundum JCM 15548]
MKKKCSLMVFMVLAILMICLSSIGQNVIPPAPESSSLTKFIDVPVNHFSGLPDISIPIYNIKSDGLNVPIGLIYHARGIGVEEIASRVGVGWALNAGGAIVRQTRGLPDDFPNGYLDSDFYSTFHTDETTRHLIYDKCLDNICDMEPDRFSYSFMGMSGNFYFDQRTKQIVQENYTDIKIEPIFEIGLRKILGWVVMMDDGFKYYFGVPKIAAEENRIARGVDKMKNFKATLNNCYELGSAFPEVYSSWQLVDIENPNGSIVCFNYENEDVTFCRKSYDTIESDKAASICVSYFSEVESSQPQIKSIVFDGGVVHFHKSVNQREDLNGGHYLKSIEVVNLYGRIVKKFQMDYSYSYDATVTNVLPLLAIKDPYAAKRLFLDSVTELSLSNSLPPYSFTYSFKSELPNRFSTSQDYWGYFNGKNNGRFLNFSGADEPGDDKTVDASKSRIGLLERMMLPTGGSVDYYFEPNQAIPPDYFSELKFNKVNPVFEKDIGLFKNIKQRVSEGVYESNVFSIDNDVSNYLHASFTLFGEFRYSAKIVKKDGSVSVNIPEGTNDILSSALTTGLYKLRVTALQQDAPDDLANGFSVFVRWTDSPISPLETIYSGGSRISRIEMNDLNGQIIKKSFEYLNDYNRSSGNIYSLPCYHFISSISHDGIHHEGVRPGGPMSYSRGNHIGYAYVTEIFDGGQDNSGKTLYCFTHMEDVGEFWIWPYTIPDSNESFRGKPLRIDSFKWDIASGSYSLMKRINYNYLIYGNRFYSGSLFPFVDPNSQEPVLSSYNIDKSKFCIPLVVFSGDGENSIHEPHNSYSNYFLRGGVVQMVDMEEIEYREGGVIKSLVENEYDNQKSYQLKQNIRTRSDGSRITTNLFYPDDFNGLVNLQENHFKNLPVKTEKKINNVLVEGSVIEYNSSGQPITYYEYHNQNAEENHPHNADVLIPDKYNAECDLIYNGGRLVEYDQKTSVKYSYHWGYRSQYRVIQAQNVDFETLSLGVNTVLDSYFNSQSLDDLLESLYAMTSSQSKATWNYFNERLREHFSHSDVVIETYTYEPLVGLTSKTDMNGLAEYYEYDDFGRLKFIRDSEDNLISNYDYHFAGLP